MTDTVSEHDPLARPAGACVTCPPPRNRAWIRADPGFVTCSPCYDRMRERIAEVAERYLKLSPFRQVMEEVGSRPAPGFESRSPASEHVIAMRDVRSSQDARVWIGADGRVHQEDERPPVSVHGVLSLLSWSIAEHRGVSGPSDRDDVYALLRFLDRHVDYITRNADLAREVDAGLHLLLTSLRPFTGDRRRRIGKCPNVPEGAEDRCGSVLFAPADSLTTLIKCRACGRDWEMSEWITLGDEADPVADDEW